MTNKSPGFAANPAYGLEFLPSPRRVRVELNGEMIADSTAVMLAREERRAPVYYFPITDIRMNLMAKTNHQTQCDYRGVASHWSVTVGGVTAKNAMWAYETPFDETASFSGYAAFNWKQMDHWYEEDEEIFLHPRDPKRRVDVVSSSRAVEIFLHGESVARSTRSMFLFETRSHPRYYLPPEDVRMELLSPSTATSICPYKGTARYWSATVGGKTTDDVAWSYTDPIPECPKIKGLIAFYNERVDAVLVDGVAQSLDRPHLDWR